MELLSSGEPECVKSRVAAQFADDGYVVLREVAREDLAAADDEIIAADPSS